MGKEKTVIRTNKNKDNPYVMIDKYGLLDTRLSAKAKGILCYLLAMPDDWQIYVTELIGHFRDGEDSIRSGLKELREFGYLSMQRIRDEKGRITHTEYIVYERPIEPENPTATRDSSISGKSRCGKSRSGKSTSGKSGTTNKQQILNNDLTNNDLTNNNNNNSENAQHPTDKPSKPEQKKSVVVVSDQIKELLVFNNITVNTTTIKKWLELADEATILEAIKYTLQKQGIENVVGYITKLLKDGFHLPVPSREFEPVTDNDPIKQIIHKYKKTDMPPLVVDQLINQEIMEQFNVSWKEANQIREQTRMELAEARESAKRR